MVRSHSHGLMQRARWVTARRPAFTLLEALVASAILFVVVVSVTSAITAGQQHAFEAQQRIAATIAAEELMGRLVAEDYDQLPAWHGYTETIGNATDVNGDPLPPSFASIGRTVSITTTLETLPGPDVKIRGRTVRVQGLGPDQIVMADIAMFIPEPPPEPAP